MTGINPWLSEATRDELADAGLEAGDVLRVVSTAFEEDLRYGPDITTRACVPSTGSLTVTVRARAAGTLAGLPVALAVLDTALGPDGYDVHAIAADGDRVGPGDDVLLLSGDATGLLTAERTMLNLLCHLSGIATVTARWVEAVAGTGCRIRDSRKTLPGLRLLQKYAVRCGGGVNHRLGLGDAALVKDNHIAAAGSVTAALDAVRRAAPELPCQVEVDTLDQLVEALDAGATFVLLDNLSAEECAKAVRLAGERAPGTRTRLEASGGLTLEVARRYAESGVDYLAVGGLTHSAPALDLGMDIGMDIGMDA